MPLPQRHRHLILGYTPADGYHLRSNMVPGPGGRPYLVPAGRVDLTAIADHQRKRGLTALPAYGLGIALGELLSAGSLFADHLRGEVWVQLGIDRSGGLSVRTVPGFDLR